MNVPLTYLTWKTYMKELYGEALFRVPVDLGYGCPNRSDSGEGGCAFCAEDGGRARQIAGTVELQDQVEKAASFARRRYGARKFMLYIQAYTGTFADCELLKKQINQLLEVRKFDALSIGTRPDCLPDDVLDYLVELNRRLDVWIELGVQSTHDRTLERVNRGHDWKSSRDAIERIHAAGLKVAVHLILGLPGESSEDWQVSADRIASLPVAAVKLHNLHVITGTALANEYADAPFPLLDEHRYAQAVIDVIRRIPCDIPLMRLTTDTPDEALIAPEWSMTKGEFAEYLVERMGFQGVRQGDLCGSAGTQLRLVRRSPSHFKPLPTDDGSITFWSERFKEHFHTKVGAATEAICKFVEPSGIRQRLIYSDIRLLDVCFGLGYNSFSACEAAEQGQGGHLQVTALEIDVNVVRSSAGLIKPQEGALLDWRGAMRVLAETGSWSGEYSSIRLLNGDARDLLPEVTACGPFDVIFLDAFSTQRNAELWTVDFFRRLRGIMAEDGVLLTYCTALPVRSGMMQAGFYVGATDPVGRQRGGTIAAMREEDTGMPLSSEELALIRNTKRGIPYRDPDQVWTNRRILKQREMERRNY